MITFGHSLLKLIIGLSKVCNIFCCLIQELNVKVVFFVQLALYFKPMVSSWMGNLPDCRCGYDLCFRVAYLQVTFLGSYLSKIAAVAAAVATAPAAAAVAVAVWAEL
jgi:hypothetical protein